MLLCRRIILAWLQLVLRVEKMKNKTNFFERGNQRGRPLLDIKWERSFHCVHFQQKSIESTSWKHCNIRSRFTHFAIRLNRSSVQPWPKAKAYTLSHTRTAYAFAIFDWIINLVFSVKMKEEKRWQARQFLFRFRSIFSILRTTNDVIDAAIYACWRLRLSEVGSK